MWGLAPACLAFSKLKKMLVRWRSCRRITQRNQLPRRIFCGRQRSTRVRVDDRQHFSAAHSPNRQALTLNGDHSVFFVEDSHSITHVPLDAQFYPRDAPSRYPSPALPHPTVPTPSRVGRRTDPLSVAFALSSGVCGAGAPARCR